MSSLSDPSAAPTAAPSAPAAHPILTTVAAEIVRNMTPPSLLPDNDTSPTTEIPFTPLNPPVNKCNYYVKQNQTVVFDFSNQVEQKCSPPPHTHTMLHSSSYMPTYE